MKTKSFSTASGAVLALGAAFLAVSPDAAAQIVTYNIGGVNSVATSVAASGVATGLSASSLDALGGLDKTYNPDPAINGAFIFNGWTSPDDSSVPAGYLQFTITPQVGYISYSTVAFSAVREKTDLFGDGSLLFYGPTTWKLAWSDTAGHSGDFGTKTIANTVGNLEQITYAGATAFDVSSLNTAANTAGAVTFKLYGYNGESTTLGGLGNSLDLAGVGGNLIVNGLAVPEPQQFAMLAGLGLLAFAAYRRYNFQKA